MNTVGFRPCAARGAGAKALDGLTRIKETVLGRKLQRPLLRRHQVTFSSRFFFLAAITFGVSTRRFVGILLSPFESSSSELDPDPPILSIISFSLDCASPPSGRSDGGIVCWLASSSSFVSASSRIAISLAKLEIRSGGELTMGRLAWSSTFFYAALLHCYRLS